MQELDPSPVQDEFPDLESGDYFPREPSPPSAREPIAGGGRFSSLKLGLRGHSWDSWCMAKYMQAIVIIARIYSFPRS